jgi:hypothetical protein
MVMCGVLFEARTELLNIVQTSLGFKGLRELQERIRDVVMNASENMVRMVQNQTALAWEVRRHHPWRMQVECVQ